MFLSPECLPDNNAKMLGEFIKVKFNTYICQSKSINLEELHCMFGGMETDDYAI